MEPRNIVVDGITYAPVVAGNRHVVVVDRGWIFAGDLSEADGRLTLSNAVQVMRWQRNGFAGLCADPKKAEATLLAMSAPVEIPEGAEIFRVPVDGKWGL